MKFYKIIVWELHSFAAACRFRISAEGLQRLFLSTLFHNLRSAGSRGDSLTCSGASGCRFFLLCTGSEAARL